MLLSPVNQMADQTPHSSREKKVLGGRVIEIPASSRKRLITSYMAESGPTCQSSSQSSAKSNTTEKAESEKEKEDSDFEGFYSFESNNLCIRS